MFDESAEPLEPAVPDEPYRRVAIPRDEHGNEATGICMNCGAAMVENPMWPWCPNCDEPDGPAPPDPDDREEDE